MCFKRWYRLLGQILPSEVRLLAVCLVAFAGFLRCDELIKLKCRDVTFNDQGMVINIVSSKTDQYREGSSLVIAHPHVQ